MILAGDIGGTKSLLALFERGDLRRAAFERRYASRAFPDFAALLGRFLEEARAMLGGALRVDAASFGIAGPVVQGRVQVTNLPWIVEAAELERRFAIGRVALVNDLAALVHGLDTLAARDLATLQAGEPVAGAPRVALGAATGLGIAYAIARPEGGYQPIAGEGGHTAFAPATDAQAALWRALHERLGRVTLEHVLSGPGLVRIYEFLGGRGADPAEITHGALERGDALAGAALDLFIACYGAAAGDHALNVMARGGVFVAGGVAAAILPRLAAGGFVSAFNDKAAFSEHTRRMPVHVVMNPRAGLLGAAACTQRGNA